nr:hypothetical protein [Gemmatimonadota bacterium]
AAWSALALFLTGLAGLACEGAEPSLSPHGPPHAIGLASAGPEEVGGFSTTGLVTFLTPPDLSSNRHAGKRISAARGGFVELQGFRVDIPRGALARDTFVTIDLPTTLPEASYVVAEFGPSGLQFSRPAQVTLPLAGANLGGIGLDKINVYHWTGTRWVDHGGDATSSSVRAPTSHFSVYGAGSRKGGIDTTSGG